MILGIDEASNIRGGGGVVHLVELLHTILYAIAGKPVKLHAPNASEIE
jgi:hypothetical protein